MDSTNDANRYSLPSNSTSERELAERLRRGLIQEIDGIKEQLAGKRQQLNAINAHLGYGKGGDSAER